MNDILIDVSFMQNGFCATSGGVFRRVFILLKTEQGGVAKTGIAK